jgi:hypothetical protein
MPERRKVTDFPGLPGNQIMEDAVRLLGRLEGEDYEVLRALLEEVGKIATDNEFLRVGLDDVQVRLLEKRRGEDGA